MGCLRLFLAVVVAHEHLRATYLLPSGEKIWPLFGFNGGHAVFFFYSISGFLITYALTVNYTQDRSGIMAFYKGRIVRIYPVYLAALLFSAVMFRGVNSEDPIANFTQIFLIGQDWSAFFRPDFSGSPEGLHQAWTLGAELTFYLFAPLLVRSWRLTVLLCIASCACRIGFLIWFGISSHPKWTYYFLPSTVCFFLFGQMVCFAGQRYALLLKPAFALLAPASIVATAIVQLVMRMYGNVPTGLDNPVLWIAYPLVLISLPALFAATRNSPAMNFLGNLSYPLYLIHGFVLLYIHDLIPYLMWMGGAVTATVSLALCLLASAVVHEIIERPLSKLLRVSGTRQAFIGARL